MIVVTGATGQAGSEVVRALAARGERVRAFVRDPGTARRKLGEDVELAAGDLADPRSVRAALDGADALFLSCADDPRRVGWETSAIDAAVAAGCAGSSSCRPWAPSRVRRSRSGTGTARWRNTFGVRNGVGDPAVQLVHVEPARRRRAGGGRGPAVRARGQARVAMIDPRDVGAAAAALLSSPGHEGKTYLITGPEAITFTEVCAGLSAATGRRIEFTDIPGEAAEQAMIGGGMPAFAAGQISRDLRPAAAGSGPAGDADGPGADRKRPARLRRLRARPRAPVRTRRRDPLGGRQ